MLGGPATSAPESRSLSECLDRLAANSPANRPLATYRLQFRREFRFEDARRLVPYLRRLGISHCYASPILRARPGSQHGYDITDHNAINPEVGSPEEFRSFVGQLQAHAMGLVLDIVPNHMGVMGVKHGTNPWWQDVLANGRTSPYAEFFDIDWDPFKPELHEKVLLPLLSASYGEELEQGHIRLQYQDGHFFVTYYTRRLPVDPQTIPLIFEPLGALCARFDGGQPRLSELEDVLRRIRNLPPHTVTDAELVGQRREQIPRLTGRLAALVESSPPVRRIVEEAVRVMNGIPGDGRSFDPLHLLLEAQAYRLALWRVSAEEINYRRFLDINDLVGLRMENPRVFAATHQLIRRLLAEGNVSGLRVDHPDGLLNPRQYLTRLQMLYTASQCCGAEPRPPLAENGVEVAVQEIFGQYDWASRRPSFYVVIEKILEPGEDLPQGWPVDGTSGYDFLNQVSGIFIEQRNARALTNIYRRFTGGVPDPDQLVYESKKQVMQNALASEVTVLSHMLDEISSADRRARDFTRKALADAIRETIACFPVYRTYIDERGQISERDRAYISEAIARAKRRNTASVWAAFDFLRDILLLREGDPGPGPEGYRKRLHFTLKFQQLSGPVMAKGLEDTVCYVYNRLVSLNEVGGSPRQFGISVEDFHRANLRRLEHWPFSMLATSTHDTKRSEDVRARINVLSEMPKQWSAEVMRWRRLNRTRKRPLSDGRTVPDHNEEYLLYQTLVGSFPFNFSAEAEDYTRRIQQYMFKAVHEAKVNLSWINPEPEYSDALQAFVAQILSLAPQRRHNLFLGALERFAALVGFFGAMNSLAQILLKITAPGVPDLYQGTELWDFSLVDPDNRRAVDFERPSRMLSELEQAAAFRPHSSLCEDLTRTYQDGRIKLWVAWRALSFRRERASMFQTGSYLPLSASGQKREHVCAFARRHAQEAVLVAVPRLVYELTGGEQRSPTGEVWGDTELPAPPETTKLRDVFTGKEIQPGARGTLLCRELFAHFPVALLACY
jgi:(1->4)-alpha-D-glucan 1-alpha-D-glucosylmutase